MKNAHMALAFGLTLAACHTAGQSGSAVQSGTAASSTSDVSIYGPYDAKFDTLTLTQKDGLGFKVEIDHRTIKSCWAPYMTISKEIARGEYMVEFKPLVHPAVVCSPTQQRDIEIGAVINVPAKANFNYVRIHVKRIGANATPVVVTGDNGADVQQSSVEETYQSYAFSQTEGKAFTVKIDRQTIKGCYASVGYPVSEYASRNYFVNIQRLMVPAVVCSPTMMRDIEIGAEIKVPANNNYSSASLYVTPVPGGAKAKVEATID